MKSGVLQAKDGGELLEMGTSFVSLRTTQFTDPINILTIIYFEAF